MKTAVVLFLLTTTGGLAVAAEFQVAEYRADVDDLVWNLGSQPGTPAYPAADADVEGVQESSRLVYGLELGTYQFPEIFDQYQSISNGENNPPEDAITLGPTIQFSPNSVAQLFYSDEQDQGAETPEIGDSFARRAGLTQTWYLARRQARITLGYEFERSETDDVYDDLQAHSVVFSSRFPGAVL